MTADSLDVIVRCHDPARIAELDRCLFSLAMQDYAPILVHVMCQRFTADALRSVADAVAPTMSLNPAVRLVWHDFDAPTPADARAAMLNAGIAAANGRYIAFLDYDDVIHPGGYGKMIQELAETGHAIAFASVAVKSVICGPHASTTTDRQLLFAGTHLAHLFHDNFCPIHSLLIDRSKIGDTDLRFDLGMDALEDYDFLLRICARYRASFRLIGTVVGDYYFKDDGSNTTPVGASATSEKRIAWRRAEKVVTARKRRLEVGLDVQRSMGIRHPVPGATVADLEESPHPAS